MCEQDEDLMGQARGLGRVMVEVLVRVRLVGRWQERALVWLEPSLGAYITF